ncbi:MAG: nitroreductase [Prolixibacteraceae bacterium]|nr:nitroreductase [Prolixibacteraceae bacterium]
MANQLDNIIKNRRATPARFLSKNEISKEIIQGLLINANWAPTHKKTEPWRFKVFTGNAKQKFAEKASTLLKEKVVSGVSINEQKIDKFKDALDRVPVVIAIILNRSNEDLLTEWEEIAAVSMAVQNMWLTATSLGLGAFWASPDFMEFLTEMLELKANQKPMGFFYVGEIAMDYPSQGRGDINDKVEWIE